ncbi:MAG: trypsin-like peptidase domain-containing protein [Planctomycetota bacterium]
MGTVSAADATADAPQSSPRSSPSISAARETPAVLAFRRAAPAVVNIHGQKTVRSTAASMAGATGKSTLRQVNGMGTGVVIDPRGYVITNFHVVEDVADIRVTLHDNTEVRADLIASKVRNDLALIKIRGEKTLKTIPRGTSGDLMVGESIIAIGNAFGYTHTMTTGIISALHRDVPVNETQDYEDLIQVSAGINPGNSGGPLLNIDGEMIGVNVAVRVGAQQIAFAIPIDQVIETVTGMIEDHNARRFTLGVRTAGGPRDGDGVTVAQVTSGSVAQKEGLKPGDRVLRVAGRTVDDRLDYALAMLTAQTGKPVSLEVERDAQLYQLALQLNEVPRRQLPPSDIAWQAIGVQAKRVSTNVMRRINARNRTSYTGGLYITAVRPGSAAAEQGIQEGDILLGIHGWQTASINDLAGIVEQPEVQQGPCSKFYIVRRDQMLYGHLELAAKAGKTLR